MSVRTATAQAAVWRHVFIFVPNATIPELRFSATLGEEPEIELGAP